MIPFAFLLLLLGAFYAWRYSLTEVDPDWALFNMAAFTGSLYGRDFVDCKTPGVHLWYWALAKLFGTDARRVKFANHFLISAAGAIYCLATGDFWGGLAFVVLINSGRLLAFHGTTGAVPGALLFLALASPSPWLSAALALAAFCFQPKLLFTAALLALRWPWEITGGAGVLLCCAALFRFSLPQWFAWTWECSVTMGRLMHKNRGKYSLYPWTPWFTSEGLLYFLPWVIFAVLARPDPLYWLPPLGYWLLIGLGGAIRQNHLLPLVPFVAAAGMTPELVLVLAAVDWISGGFYFGDLWMRFYLGLRDSLIGARQAGEWLRDQPGEIWVNSLHSEVYIHARKPVPYGLAEQIELREAAADRRAKMLEAWRLDPPDWLVMGPSPALQVGGGGFEQAWSNGMFTIYKRTAVRKGSA